MRRFRGVAPFTGDNLTDAQKAKIFALSAFWANEATSTARANRFVAEACINAIYTLNGLPEPKKRWMSSPLSALIDAGADIERSIAFDLEKEFNLRMYDIVSGRAIDADTVLATRSTRLFLPVGLVTTEEEERHLRIDRKSVV